MRDWRKADCWRGEMQCDVSNVGSILRGNLTWNMKIECIHIGENVGISRKIFISRWSDMYIWNNNGRVEMWNKKAMRACAMSPCKVKYYQYSVINYDLRQ